MADRQPAASGTGLADELQVVVRQAEELLRALGVDGDVSLEALRERVEASLETARVRLAELEQEAGRVTRQAADAARNYMRENPWGAVAIGAAAGVLIGALLTPRRSVRGRIDT